MLAPWIDDDERESETERDTTGKRGKGRLRERESIWVELEGLRWPLESLTRARPWDTDGACWVQREKAKGREEMWSQTTCTVPIHRLFNFFFPEGYFPQIVLHF